MFIEIPSGGEEQMSGSYYDVAQICENGHVANSMAQKYPGINQEHCDRCGAPTIMACPSCQTAIRGYYHVTRVVGFDDYAAPAFCYKCGNPFPWTAARLRAAEDLADELDRPHGRRTRLSKEKPARSRPRDSHYSCCGNPIQEDHAEGRKGRL